MLLSTAEASTYSAQEVAARLRVDVRTGLRWAEANSRSKIVGYNELNALDEEPTWMKYVQQFKNPLILLLLGKFEVSCVVTTVCYQRNKKTDELRPH